MFITNNSILMRSDFKLYDIPIPEILFISCVIYIIGIVIYVLCNTNDRCELTPRIARMSLIWPLIIIGPILSIILIMTNGVICYIGMIFGLKYTNSIVYKKSRDWMNILLKK